MRGMLRHYMGISLQAGIMALLIRAPASWPASTFQVKFPKLLFPLMSQLLAAGRTRPTKHLVHVTHLMHACHGSILLREDS